MYWWRGLSLVPVTACRLFDAKLLPKPVLNYCQMQNKSQTSLNQSFPHNVIHLRIVSAKHQAFRPGLNWSTPIISSCEAYWNHTITCLVRHSTGFMVIQELLKVWFAPSKATLRQGNPCLILGNNHVCWLPISLFDTSSNYDLWFLRVDTQNCSASASNYQLLWFFFQILCTHIGPISFIGAGTMLCLSFCERIWTKWNCDSDA